MLPATQPSPAETLLESALSRIESASIKAWATSEHNRPVWLRFCEAAIANGKADAARVATLILCNAIGL